ncbi:hypothetical protein R2F25_17300 [Streptomyces sp. UP1A-1]|nr:hypothetical protein [Streptomyces sp. UP1A-1]
MLRRAGVQVEGRDPAAGARALLDGGAFLSGDTDQVLEKLKAYEAAGVDEVVLNLTGVYNLVGAQAAMSDLKKLLTALAT